MRIVSIPLFREPVFLCKAPFRHYPRASGAFQHCCYSGKSPKRAIERPDHGSKDTQPAVRRVPSADDPILRDVVGRLVRAYQPERVYLFGSAARGDAGLDSDYDILVVVADNSPPGQQDEGTAYEALVGRGAVVDVLVYRASDFCGRLPLRASLPNTVVREGKLLYAA
jgi:hypothetical protein